LTADGIKTCYRHPYADKIDLGGCLWVDNFRWGGSDLLSRPVHFSAAQGCSFEKTPPDFWLQWKQSNIWVNNRGRMDKQTSPLLYWQVSMGACQ
jgi:hypothetical protein